MEAPKANPENLLAILEDAYKGKVVVPEFQRSFLWSRDGIEELLVSILQGYFVGTLLLLDTQSSDPLFPYRTIEGLDKVNPDARPSNHQTIRLVLDGQQRITSLFYVLYEPDRPLKNISQAHRFFFRIDLALDGDPEDAVVGLPVSSKRRISEMRQLIAEHKAIPFSMFRDERRLYRWLYTEQTFLIEEHQKDLVEGFCKNFTNFLIPVVALPGATKKNDIVNIFERVNRTGISLSTFDLAVARLYRKDVKLRDLWKRFEKSHSAAAASIKPEYLLKFISLMQGKVPRKSTLVDVADDLSHDAFESSWELATEYMAKAHTRLMATSGGYGAFDARWIPYNTLLVPLAYLLMEIEKMKGGEAEYRKLDTWYWTSVFSERYDSAVDTKSNDDIKAVLEWTKNDTPINWIGIFNASNVDLTVDDQRAAVYRGVMCLIALRGARDFCSGQPADLHKCDDDHIFPRSKYKEFENVNAIVNRTLISPESNREIKRAKRPPEYLGVFLKKHGGNKARLRQTLESHFITEEGIDAMKSGTSGDFETFFSIRQQALVNEIRKRTSA